MSTLSTQFAENLIGVRNDRKLTQGEIADQIGCSTAHISQIEKLYTDARLSEIDKLAPCLGMHPLALVAGISEDVAELVDRLSGMDTQKRKLTLKLFNVSLELMEVSKNWPADSVNGR